MCKYLTFMTLEQHLFDHTNMKLLIVILCVVPVTLCNGHQSSIGASKFLKSKWKIKIKSTDVNHDGIWSMADLKEARNKFSELNRSDNYTNLDTWWNECVVSGKDGQVTESEFIAATDKYFTRDKREFHCQMVTCEEKFAFDIIDTNKDKSISEEEFNILLNIFGQGNDDENAEFFRSYDPVDNLIPARKFSESWVYFETNEDESKQDKVKNHYDDAASGQ